jgi:peptide/nickel transport system substrate-binding protein
MRKHLKISCVVFLILLLAAACDPGINHTDKRASTITVLMNEGFEWILSPHWDEYPEHLVFLPLVKRNASGEFESRLAQAWEHSPDYRSWTVHLRTDVRGHDGVPFTAHDVAFSLKLDSQPGIGRIPPDSYTIRIHDDSTYTITYKNPGVRDGSPLEDDYVFYPKHLLENLPPEDYMNWEFWLAPVGNGPYRHVRTLPQTMIEFEANPDFYRGKPKIERVVIKFGSQSLTELLSGNVDIVWQAEPMDLLVVDQKRFKVYGRLHDKVFTSILWNHRLHFFRDVRVRRALTLAVDRKKLHRVLNFLEDTPIVDGFFSTDQFRRGELPVPLPYDPELAQQLLEDVGWRDLNGDGFRERGGKPFRFTALCTKGTNQIKSATLIQQQLKEVGVLMEIQELEHAVKYRRMRAGDFEADFTHIRRFPGSIVSLVGEGSLGPSMGYRNDGLAELYGEIQKTWDPNRVDELYREVATIMREDQPVMLLHPGFMPTLAHRRVKGLDNTWHKDPFKNIADLWLEDEKE